jgi:hypothetical protein
MKVRGGGLWFSFEIAVEGKTFFDRADLHQAGSGIWKSHHRRKNHFARLLAADLLEQLFHFRRKRVTSGQNQVRPEQRFGLLVDAHAQIFRERTDRDQRCNSNHDRRRKEQQLPSTGAAVPPGHSPGPGRKEGDQQLHGSIGSTF